MSHRAEPRRAGRGFPATFGRYRKFKAFQWSDIIRCLPGWFLPVCALFALVIFRKVWSDCAKNGVEITDRRYRRGSVFQLPGYHYSVAARREKSPVLGSLSHARQRASGAIRLGVSPPGLIWRPSEAVVRNPPAPGRFSLSAGILAAGAELGLRVPKTPQKLLPREPNVA